MSHRRRSRRCTRSATSAEGDPTPAMRRWLRGGSAARLLARLGDSPPILFLPPCLEVLVHVRSPDALLACGPPHLGYPADRRWEALGADLGAFADQVLRFIGNSDLS